MTATDELRRMLDEREVEYTVDHGYHEYFWDFGETGLVRASHIGTKGLVQMIVTGITPEQAIAVTLGLGACHADETETWQGVCMSNPIRYVRNLTIHVMECSACGGTYEHVNGGYEFCPRCGAKVIG